MQHLPNFARNLPDLRKICGESAKSFLQKLRNVARNLRPRLLRYRLFLSDPETSPDHRKQVRRALDADRRPESDQRLTLGVPLASGALSVVGFCGFLRKFCGILRMFAEFCGFLLIFADFCGLFAEFCGIFAEFRGILRNVCGILRTNTKGTRAKGHQCEALRWPGSWPQGSRPEASPPRQ